MTTATNDTHLSPSLLTKIRHRDLPPPPHIFRLPPSATNTERLDDITCADCKKYLLICALSQPARDPRANHCPHGKKMTDVCTDCYPIQ